MIETFAATAMAVTLTVSSPDKLPPAKCKNNVALMLWDAGFTGRRNAVAWAITWRESHHQNLDESSPYYTGALGMWQVQTSAHAGKGWWSRSAMLDPAKQSRIVYKYMSDKGRNWQAWGLNSDGTAMDVTQYGGWSGDQQWAWIWAPYVDGLELYPKQCWSRS